MRPGFFVVFIAVLVLIVACVETAPRENRSEPRPIVEGFTLLNTHDGSVIGPLTDGAAITPAEPIAIRADVSGPVEYVEFRIDGNLERTEREAPYTLAGDVDGTYTPFETRGTLRLEASPYGTDGLGRSKEITITIEGFEPTVCGDGVCQDEESSSACSADCGPATYCGDGLVQEPNDDGVIEECDDGAGNGNACTPETGGSCEYCTDSCTIGLVYDDMTSGASVDSFSLVTSPDGAIVDEYTPIADGSTISIDDPITIVAETSGDVSSVEFFIDGTSEQTESTAPYTIAGDNNGVYTEFTATGTHKIRAVATASDGSIGTSKEITITIEEPEPTDETDDTNDKNEPTDGAPDTQLLVGPREDIEIPSDATIIDAGDDAAGIVSGLSAGDTIVFAAGTHRVEDVRPKSDMHLIGEYGAVLSGADVVSGFEQNGAQWYVDGMTDSLGPWSGARCDDPMCAHRDQLFIDDEYLHQVGSVTDVGAGSWHYDYNTGRITIGTDPSDRTVELTVRRRGIWPWKDSSDITVENLIIEKYGSGQGHGGIHTAQGSTIKNNEIRYNSAKGLSMNDGVDLIGNHIHHNGQYGLSGSQTTNAVLEGNDISYNNIAGYQSKWASGAHKFVGSSNMIVRNNHVHHNHGPGIWFDWENHNILIEGNLVEHNLDQGIFYEVSHNATIRNNVVRGGADFGIYLSNTKGTRVINNTVEGNARGIVLANRNRHYSAYQTKDNLVRDNTITQAGDTSSWTKGVAAGLFNHNDEPDLYTGSWNNRFENNTYFVDGLTTFYWENSEMGFSEWQVSGHDTSGSATQI